MTKPVRYITAADKPLLAIVLLNAGVKARLAVQRSCIRAVIAGDFDRDAVVAALNEYGFRDAGAQPFARISFQGEQLFVRGMEA